MTAPRRDAHSCVAGLRSVSVLSVNVGSACGALPGRPRIDGEAEFRRAPGGDIDQHRSGSGAIAGSGTIVGLPQDPGPVWRPLEFGAVLTRRRSDGSDGTAVDRCDSDRPDRPVGRPLSLRPAVEGDLLAIRRPGEV